jgi:hypothetical protein
LLVRRKLFAKFKNMPIIFAKKIRVALLYKQFCYRFDQKNFSKIKKVNKEQILVRFLLGEHANFIQVREFQGSFLISNRKSAFAFLRKVRKSNKFADLRLAELYCGPSIFDRGEQASMKCKCCCVVLRFMPCLTQLLLRGKLGAIRPRPPVLK